MAATEAATHRIPRQLHPELYELVVLSRVCETGRQHKAGRIGGYWQHRLLRGARKQRCPGVLEAVTLPRPGGRGMCGGRPGPRSQRALVLT